MFGDAAPPRDLTVPPLSCAWCFGTRLMDAIYHRTHLGDALLHSLQKLCVGGELEGGEARMILADFNEVQMCSLHSLPPKRQGPAHSRGCISTYICV